MTEKQYEDAMVLWSRDQIDGVTIMDARLIGVHFQNKTGEAIVDLKNVDTDIVKETHFKIQYIEAQDTFTWFRKDVDSEKVDYSFFQPTTLEEYKTKRKWQLDQDYQALLNQGYYNEGAGVTLAINESDQTAFTKLLSLLKLAEDLGQEIPDQYISDINGNMVGSFPLLTLKGLLLQYGIYYQTIWSNLVMKKNLVDGCETIEDVLDVDL